MASISTHSPLRRPFGQAATHTSCLEIHQKMFSDRIQPPRRRTAGDHHVVGNIGFPFQGNNLDIVGLVIVERFLDECQNLRRCWPRLGLYPYVL